MSERTIREQFSDMAVVLSIKDPNSKAFFELYAEMVQFMYKLDEIYIILDTNFIDTTRGVTIPLALKKDKFPAIYIFTDKELAMKWCDHYKFYYDNTKYPIGVLRKEELEYMNVFQIAMQLGIYKAFVNEGDRLLCMNIADMIKINNLNTNMMVLPIEKIEEMLIQKQTPIAPIRFNTVAIDGFEFNEENVNYIKTKAASIFDDFKKFASKFKVEVVDKGIESKNGGFKVFTVFYEKNADLIEGLKNKEIPAMEKAFFELIEKIDDKKLFDNRYSYMKFETKEAFPSMDEYFKNGDI